MAVLRAHAVELARSAVSGAITGLQREDCDQDERQRQQNKENILARLKRLIPVAATGVNAMVDEDGHITASPEGVAGILKTHWAKVFARWPIDQWLLDGWLRDSFMCDGHGRSASGLPDAKAKRWRVSRKDVASAITRFPLRCTDKYGWTLS